MSKRYTTIPVSEEVKEKLESIKGEKSWDEFLLLLVDEYNRRINGIKRLREIITDEELRKIEDSHRKMHEEFRV
ncbi:antitoxin VapB family protein [Sulfurisphaera ohwakuensis]|uniref:Putative CopG family antitoxin n=1 Tax=Sulfurisphaera ohwakuensis TaxID=69656 RepID=A0A650CJ42_SULOH|nr:antitoxin VapB family protein [Sulfurisphaera ohwakuensis]MBB5253945.1 putative CopG family antitoxin [Sulfurisphaera ohwakuensis]QGR17832.1 hypothetical protein D1869_12100 [Sulfurisphaera ohwakuensis]